MKSFKYVCAEKGVEEYDCDTEQAFNFGSEEMRKSLRCESCLKFEDCEILRSLSGNGFDESFFEDFGCVDHKQKEEKR